MSAGKNYGNALTVLPVLAPFQARHSFQEMQSVLIVGASSHTGLECLRALSQRKHSVHAFCCVDAATPLSWRDRELCTSVIEGDPCNTEDLAHALVNAAADRILVCLADDDKRVDSVGPRKRTKSAAGSPSCRCSRLRTASAEAMVRVLLSNEHREHLRRIHVIVVSAVGAGYSRLCVGWGLGRLIQLYMRRALRDHSGQEATYSMIRHRTLIVRTTCLTSAYETSRTMTTKTNASTKASNITKRRTVRVLNLARRQQNHAGELSCGDEREARKWITFGDGDPCPTLFTNRNDLVTWILDAICDRERRTGQIVNLTSSRYRHRRHRWC